ncbi:MAG TPA: ABC transporter permease [Microvirga sp.]|jgi:ABC-2 type transport system permease protein/lipopolysaccharide transport system permease protein|nr:ABC transporter permease [Microvirga sp.]
MSQTVQEAAPPAHLGEPVDVETELRREWRRAALADLWQGLLQWPLWFTIGWMDVRQRYRRSLIGPFWITLSLGFFVTGLSVIYSALFRMELGTYIPYLGTGIIVWTLISSLLTEGCSTFIAAERAIKQVPVPVSVHLYRMVWRNAIIFAHNFLIYIVVVVLFGVPVGFATLLAIPGVLLVLLNGIGFGLILGMLSARFRDIPLIITNLVQLVFFASPILWRAGTLPPERAWVVTVNPFHYLIDNIREPLLGQVPALGSWGVAAAFTAINLAVGAALYARYRARIAYWL